MRLEEAERVAHQEPSQRHHGPTGVAPHRDTGSDIHASLGSAIPASNDQRLPGRLRIEQTLGQGRKALTVAPRPPDRAGLARRCGREQAGIYARGFVAAAVQPTATLEPPISANILTRVRADHF